MKRGIIKKYSILGLFVFFIVFSLISISVSGIITKGDYYETVETSYSPDENLRGWINISVSDAEQDLIIDAEGNFEGNISLRELFEINKKTYSCELISCNEILYAPKGNGEINPKIELLSDSFEIKGLKLEGIITDIRNFSLKLSTQFSTSKGVCFQAPVKIDFLNNGKYEFISKKATQEYDCKYDSEKGSAGKGCFDETSFEIENVDIGVKPYCEKISFAPAQSFKIGASLKKNGNYVWHNRLLKMSLYSIYGDLIESCFLTQEPTRDSFEEIGCIVSHSVEKLEDYYVCINANISSGIIPYQTQMEKTSGESCGFRAVYGITMPEESELKADYNIFAYGARFDYLDNFLFYDNNLLQDINDFLYQRYSAGNYLNCTGLGGCIFPIKIESEPGAEIDFSNIKLEYEQWDRAGTLISEKLYDLTTEKPKMSSIGYVLLNLDKAGIKVPSSFGNHTLKLKIGGSEFLRKEIVVEKVPQISKLNPLIVAAGISVEFTVEATSPANNTIVWYNWTFEENKSYITTTNKKSYTYFSSGNYEIKIEVKDNKGLTSEKIFNVLVGELNETINYLIKEYTGRLDSLEKNISVLPRWYGEKIEKKLELKEKIEIFDELKREFNSATTEEEYSKIVINLSKLDIPRRIGISLESNTPYFVDYKKIKLESLKQSDAGDYNISQRESYRTEIAAWQQENLDLNLKSKYFSSYDENYDTEHLLGVFNLKIKPKNSQINSKIYVVFQNLNLNTELVFKNFPGAQQIGEDVVIVFNDLNEKELEFILLNFVSFEDIEITISPSFSELVIIGPEKVGPCNYNYICEPERGENWKNCRNDCYPWSRTIFLIFLVFIGAIIVYIFMSQWYRINYEKKLFKNRNDIFNLINFIYFALSKGISKSEIIKKLLDQKWNKEQIAYVIRKSEGKNIIPLDISVLFNKKKMRYKKIESNFKK